jgi:hypothetical protein
MIAAAMPKTPQSARHGGALKLHRVPGFGEVSIAPHQPQPRANAPMPETGTALAINYLTLGVAANLPCTVNPGEADARPAPQSAGARFREARPARGGARNRADRESHALTAANVANLRAAASHSCLVGLPLTRMLTIHWQAAGAPLAGMAKATGRFLDLLTRWLKRKGHRTAWLWVHENGDGKGWHAHILAHVPADVVRELTGRLRCWLRAITGQPYRKGVILSRPIGGRLGLERGNPELHAVNLEAALAYVLKGASPEAASQFGLERQEPGGRVIGRRCSTSENIAAKARKAATL